MKRRVLLGAWLLIAWLALWQDLSFANVVSGVVAAAGLVLLFPVGGRGTETHLRPLATARFAAVFVWKLVEANLVVAWQAVRPGADPREGIVAVPLRTATDGVATLVADAVTLTPGTMTIEISGGGSAPITLFVHVLQLDDPDDVREEVLRFEELAIRAFGPKEELAALRSASRGKDPR